MAQPLGPDPGPLWRVFPPVGPVAILPSLVALLSALVWGVPHFLPSPRPVWRPSTPYAALCCGGIFDVSWSTAASGSCGVEASSPVAAGWLSLPGAAWAGKSPFVVAVKVSPTSSRRVA